MIHFIPHPKNLSNILIHIISAHNTQVTFSSILSYHKKKVTFSSISFYHKKTTCHIVFHFIPSEKPQVAFFLHFIRLKKNGYTYPLLKSPNHNFFSHFIQSHFQNPQYSFLVCVQIGGVRTNCQIRSAL